MKPYRYASALFFFAMSVFFQPQTLIACSDVVLNHSGRMIVSARTMDFADPLEAEVVVVPRGKKCQSIGLRDNQTYMKWVSKYGFVGTNLLHKNIFTDGMNEKGLSAAGLWLDETVYPDISKIPPQKVVLIPDAIRWILGSFRTVEQVKKALETVVIGGIGLPPIFEEENVPLHLSLHDRHNKNLVIEFINGSMAMYDNPYHVLTNGPPFPEQIANLAQYQSMTNQSEGMLGLPGDHHASDRFALLYTLNRFVQKSTTHREAVNNALHLIQRVTMVNNEVQGGSTEYTVLRDHTGLVYYVMDNQNMNTRALHLKKLNFGRGQKLRYFSIAQKKWFNISAEHELRQRNHFE